MLHRRDAMLRLGTAACGALTLPHLMELEQAKAAASISASKPSARSCIFLFMWGGLTDLSGRPFKICDGEPILEILG